MWGGQKEAQGPLACDRMQNGAEEPSSGHRAKSWLHTVLADFTLEESGVCTSEDGDASLSSSL